MPRTSCTRWTVPSRPMRSRTRTCADTAARPGPVGNGARHQLQHDVYGEIVDIAYQWSGSGKRVDERLWAALVPIVEMAIRSWRVPDSGPWEIRDKSRPFTYSAALCYVAIDRAIQIARRDGLPYPKRRWEATARQIRQAALTQSWDPRRRTFTENLGGNGVSTRRS